MPAEVEPRTVALLTENMAILEGGGSAFRLQLAQALRSEGMTIVHAGSPITVPPGGVILSSAVNPLGADLPPDTSVWLARQIGDHLDL